LKGYVRRPHVDKVRNSIRKILLAEENNETWAFKQVSTTFVSSPSHQKEILNTVKQLFV
jgi:hypothetical protein